MHRGMLLGKVAVWVPAWETSLALGSFVNSLEFRCVQLRERAFPRPPRALSHGTCAGGVL